MVDIYLPTFDFVVGVVNFCSRLGEVVVVSGRMVLMITSVFERQKIVIFYVS